MLKDSKFVHGVVFNKNIADRAMRKTIRRPRIVLVSDGIEWKHRSGGGIVSMETVRDQERKYIEIMVAKISSNRVSMTLGVSWQSNQNRSGVYLTASSVAMACKSFK